MAVIVLSRKLRAKQEKTALAPNFNNHTILREFLKNRKECN